VALQDRGDLRLIEVVQQVEDQDVGQREDVRQEEVCITEQALQVRDMLARLVQEVLRCTTCKQSPTGTWNPARTLPTSLPCDL